MESVVLVIHLMIALSIIAVVLLQRSEGGGLGIGGGNGGMGGLASPRSTADFLTRLTGVLAAAFMTTSLTLAVLSGANRAEPVSILELAGEGEAVKEITAPVSEGDKAGVTDAVAEVVDKVTSADPAAPSPKPDAAPKVPMSK